MANCAMNPAAAMEKPAMIKGERVWALSDQKETSVIIMAKRYIGIVRSCVFAVE